MSCKHWYDKCEKREQREAKSLTNTKKNIFFWIPIHVLILIKQNQVNEKGNIIWELESLECPCGENNLLMLNFQFYTGPLTKEPIFGSMVCPKGMPAL